MVLTLTESVVWNSTKLIIRQVYDSNRTVICKIEGVGTEYRERVGRRIRRQVS